MALLRARLAAMRFSSSAELRGQPDRRLVRTCGIVTVRQRPGTAKGMEFVTIEDEAGETNRIVRPDIVERQRGELLALRLLGANGTRKSRSGEHTSELQSPLRIAAVVLSLKKQR